MATSALFPLVNAVADFTVASNRIVTDPETGNVSPGDETLTYKCFLKAVNVDPEVYPGVNVNSLIYEGYVVDPQALDSRIKVGTRGSLAFGSADGVAFQVLRARLGYGDEGALGGRLSEVLGTKITLMALE